LTLCWVMQWAPPAVVHEYAVSAHTPVVHSALCAFQWRPFLCLANERRRNMAAPQVRAGIGKVQRPTQWIPETANNKLSATCKPISFHRTVNRGTIPFSFLSFASYLSSKVSWLFGLPWPLSLQTVATAWQWKFSKRHRKNKNFRHRIPTQLPRDLQGLRSCWCPHKDTACLSRILYIAPVLTVLLNRMWNQYSDTSANEDNSFRNHIR